jgi:hypothetical protein
LGNPLLPCVSDVSRGSRTSTRSEVLPCPPRWGTAPFLSRMASLPAELWGLVDEQVAVQATFAEFVTYTSRWSGERRRRLFSGWVQLIDSDSGRRLFDGTPAELQFVRDHVQGRRFTAVVMVHANQRQVLVEQYVSVVCTTWGTGRTGWALTKQELGKVICQCGKRCVSGQGVFKPPGEACSLVLWQFLGSMGIRYSFFGKLCERTFLSVAEGLPRNSALQPRDWFMLCVLVAEGAFSGQDGCVCSTTQGVQGVCDVCKTAFSTQGGILSQHV